jgi:hypothetical protein
MQKVYEFTTPREKTINDFIAAVASENYSHTRFTYGIALVYHRNPKSPSGAVLTITWDGYDESMEILKQYGRY